jgi:hypothetical protein
MMNKARKLRDEGQKLMAKQSISFHKTILKNDVGTEGD